jgi:hypothetical protein
VHLRQRSKCKECNWGENDSDWIIINK